MAFREVSMNKIREVLRVWLGVAGLPAPGCRTIAAHCGMDRKTVRRYVEARAGTQQSRPVQIHIRNFALLRGTSETRRLPIKSVMSTPSSYSMCCCTKCRLIGTLSWICTQRMYVVC